MISKGKYLNVLVDKLSFVSGCYDTHFKRVKLLEINRLFNNFNLSIPLIEVILGVIVENYREDDYFDVSLWVEDYKHFLTRLGYSESEIVGLYITIDNLMNPYDNID